MNKLNKIRKLKRKKLYSQFTEDEIYWLCVEYWTQNALGMNDGNRDNQTSA